MASLDIFEKMDTPVTMNQLKFLHTLYQPSHLQQVTADMSTSTKSKTGPLLTSVSSASIGIGEPLRTASLIPLEVCSPDKQLGKQANTKHSQSIQTSHTYAEASPPGEVPLHDWDVNWFRISFRAWRGKREQSGKRR